MAEYLFSLVAQSTHLSYNSFVNQPQFFHCLTVFLSKIDCTEDFAMAKEVKTNAMRILDKNKIPYEVLTYECDEFIDGLHTAEKTGAPVEQSFKTLVAQGKSKAYYVFVVPIAEEVDLKKAAKAAGEKSMEMIHVKDINAVTGYIRGGCTPIGMKKQYPVFIQESARTFDKIYVSGGKIGCTLKLNPLDLAGIVRAEFADFIVKQ